MKQFVILLSAICLCVSAMAQPYAISLTTSKTSSLVFPLPVHHVDRGSGAILVEQVSDAPHILLLKAAQAHFAETNLSVVTEDGCLYSFAVLFEESPATLNYHLPLQSEGTPASYAMMILDNPPVLHGPSKKSWEMKLAVSGIYVKGSALYCQITLENHGSLDYDAEFLRFVIRDQRQGKRTALQETEVQPVQVVGNYTTVKGGSRTTVVVVLPRFTIPDQKYLAIEMGEKGGGRHFRLRLGNRHIVRARPLPDLR